MTPQSHSWAYIWTKLSLKKDTCTRMFIHLLFRIAKTWKQPKCPLTDDWVRKMWYIYVCIYTYACVCVCMYMCVYICMYVCIYICICGILLSHKKEQNNAIYGIMDGTKDSYPE